MFQGSFSLNQKSIDWKLWRLVFQRISVKLSCIDASIKNFQGSETNVMTHYQSLRSHLCYEQFTLWKVLYFRFWRCPFLRIAWKSPFLARCVACWILDGHLVLLLIAFITSHGWQEIGKTIEALTISGTCTGWLSCVCRIWEKSYENHLKRVFFIIKHLNVRTWIIQISQFRTSIHSPIN